MLFFFLKHPITAPVNPRNINSILVWHSIDNDYYMCVGVESVVVWEAGAGLEIAEGVVVFFFSIT